MKPFQARMYLRRLRHSADRAAEKRRQEILQVTQPSTAYEQLSLQHKRFVDAYISTGCNGADALRLIGVTTARKGKEGLAGKATAWLRNYPLLRMAIEERKAAAVQRSHDRLIKYVENLDWIATFDFRQMLDADGNLLPMRDWPDHVAGAVASIEFEEMYDGRGEERRAVGRVTKFKLWPKIESIRLLMQFHQLLQDRHIHTGANGGPILTKNTDELTDDQLAAIAFGGSPTPAEPAPSAG
jgi:phage terminase small subunit